MTKNKTAICTPTATREEFESILMELAEYTNLTWPLGSPLSSGVWLDSFNFLLLFDGNLQRISRRRKSYKTLPRAEFISAIKRDSGRDIGKEAGDIIDSWPGWRKEYVGKPDISKMETTGEGPKIDCSYPTEIKEKTKMNYNKMTKAELVKELKEQIASVEDLGERHILDTRERTTLNRILLDARNYTTTLEKTNAEQAEKIESLANDIKMARIYEKENRDKFREVHTALIKTQSKLKEQTASISKFVADVLEGK